MADDLTLEEHDPEFQKLIKRMFSAPYIYLG